MVSEEEKRRLHLWIVSLDQSRMALRVYTRVKKIIDLTSHKSSGEEDNQAKSKIKEFHDLLTIDEFLEVWEHSYAFAVISFCQVLVSGHRHSQGVVSENYRLLDKNYQPNKRYISIFQEAFPSQSELDTFVDFCKVILSIRDKIFAHVDGDAYIMGPGYIIGKNLPNLNIEYWYSISGRLIKAVQNFVE